MRKTIIMVGGYVAGGKSTFARKLAERLNLPVFIKDTMIQVMHEHIHAEKRDEKKKISGATRGMMSYIAERLMLTGASFILESNFIKWDADILRRLIEKYEYNALTYVFVGDLHVIHKRFIERDNSPERDPANRSGGLLDDFAMFEQSIKPLGDFDAGGRIIKVDTTSFENVDFEAYIQEAIDYIENGLKAK